jgi:phytoene dehydrogenase-like protein
VVIGAGPNGLVAANALADAGWRVIVLEAAPTPGGAVRSDEVGGLVADVCSGFYPLAVASPALTRLRLEEHGVIWRRAPAVLANPLPDGDAAVLFQDPEHTAAGLEAAHAGDGAGWRRLSSRFEVVSGPVLDGLCVPFPPVRAAARLVRTLGAGGAIRLARMATLSARRLGEEELSGPAGRLLLAGCAAHTDLMADAAGGGFYGWFLAMLGQRHGFPVPEGGAANLTAALVRRLEARGGVVECGRQVAAVLLHRGTATGVTDEAGRTVHARRAVLADVSAPFLYGALLHRWAPPCRLHDDLRRFQRDRATVKVDWALAGPVPWSHPGVRQAGTVHLADSVDELTRSWAELASGEVPARPFVVLGQPAVADPTRARSGAAAVWAYSDVPAVVRGDPFGRISGRWDDQELAVFADRIEARVERHAPGFRSLVTARRVLGPAQLAALDANLESGSRNSGSAMLHQQLIWRPVPGLGRPETPVQRLYLASASAHPGGGVHGACGWNAAMAALRAQGWGGMRGKTVVAAQRRLGR